MLRSDVKMTRQKAVLWPGATPFCRRFLRPNHCRASGVAPGHVLPLDRRLPGRFCRVGVSHPCQESLADSAQGFWQTLPELYGTKCQGPRWQPGVHPPMSVGR